MLRFKLKLQTTEIAVNPQSVTYITDRREYGCVIHFIGGGSVHVDASFQDVFDQLQSHV